MEDRSGFLTFAGGMAVLIMVGVGLSMLVEKRLKFSGEQGESREMIGTDHELIESVRQSLVGSSEDLRRAEENASSTAARLQKLEILSRQQKLRVEELSSTKMELRNEVRQIDASFVTYQRDYRRKIWSSMIGSEMEVLQTRDGREYRNVVITNVTQRGLDLRHEFGVVCIQPDNLMGDWKDRFQWSPPGSRLPVELSSAP